MTPWCDEWRWSARDERSGDDAPGAQTVAEPSLLRRDADGIAWLTLNRPAARNALSIGLMEALDAELARIETDASVRVVIIGGAGPAFCAGHDLRELRANPTRAAYEAVFALCSRLMLRLVRLPQAGDRAGAWRGDRGGLPACGELRSRGGGGHRAVRDARGEYRAVLLHADGRAVACRRAQGVDGDAVDRRPGGRRAGARARAGEPGGAGRPTWMRRWRRWPGRSRRKVR